MYNNGKFVKALIIGAFLLIILLTIPFLIADKPEKPEKIDETVLNHPAVSKELQQQASAQVQPGSNMPTAETGSYAQLHQYGLSYFNQGNYAAAASMFFEALKLDPDSYIDTYYVAICQSRLREYNTAEETFASIENPYKTSASYWFARAENAEYLPGDYLYEKAQTYINNAFLYNNKSITIAKKRVDILHRSYNAYKQEYGLKSNDVRLKKPAILLYRAYNDLAEIARAKNDKDMEQMAVIQRDHFKYFIRDIQRQQQANLTNEQTAEIQNALQSVQNAVSSGKLTPQAQTAGMASNKNTGANNADIQLIENLPTLE